MFNKFNVAGVVCGFISAAAANAFVFLSGASIWFFFLGEFLRGVSCFTGAIVASYICVLFNNAMEKIENAQKNRK